MVAAVAGEDHAAARRLAMQDWQRFPYSGSACGKHRKRGKCVLGFRVGTGGFWDSVQRFLVHDN